MPGALALDFRTFVFSENTPPVPADTLLKISQIFSDTTFCKKSESRCRYYFYKKSESLP